MAKIQQVNLTDTYANLPTAASEGRIFLPSDGVQLERDSSTAWTPWGPIFPFTKPVSGDFSWVNQGGASVDTTYGGIYLNAPASTTASLRIRIKSAPTVPYTIVVGFLCFSRRVDYQSCGFVWRESGTGELVTAGIGIDTTVDVAAAVTKWDDATTWNATYTNQDWQKWSPIVFFKCEDNNTNRITSLSMDAQHWQQLHSVSRTDFLTADQVGFFCNAQNATWDMDMLLLHWEES
jgi:hypothetical protein